MHACALLLACEGSANACCIIGSTTIIAVISPNAATIANIASVVLLFIILLVTKATIYNYRGYIVNITSIEIFYNILTLIK